MKGVSEIVSTIIILLIVITSASAFFYWYQTLEGQAMGTSSEFTTNVQKQIISTSTSVIDAYYSADKQANINNWGGTTETICAKERELDLSNSKIGFIMWEGWGSNKELICSSYSLPCECLGTESSTLGAILLKSNGIGLVSTTDGSDWTMQKDTSVPMIITNPVITNINSLEFIEGGDSCKNPSNVFITGSVCDGEENCANLNIIWDNEDRASSYDEDISYAAGQETYWYDSTTMSVNLAANWPSSLSVPRLITDPQPTFLGGAAVTNSTGAYVKALLAAKYSVYDVHTLLDNFGNSGSPVSTSGVTAVEKIVRIGVNQLLVGVSKDPISGGGASYIDETTNTLDGTEKYYAGDMATCPYNLAQFDGLGYIPHNPPHDDKILNCDLTSGKVGPMLYEDDFVTLSGGTAPELDNTKPVYVAVSEISTGGNRSRVLFTGRDMDSTVFNILNDDDRLINTEISDMIYSEADNNLVVAANDLGTNKASLLYFTNAPVPALQEVLPIHGYGPIIITSLEYFDDSVWFGGYRVGLPDNVAVIYRVTNRTLVHLAYENATYLEASNLEKLTRCSENAVHCSQGCDTTLAPGQCGDITLVFENTACDISNYPTGTQFSYTLNIGEHFTRSSIFEKRTATTNELGVTEL